MKFYANPYNTDVTGFYFETNEGFLDKSAALKDSFGLPVEEFEIEVVDGTKEEIQIADLIKIHQGNLEEVIDFLDGDEQNWPAVFYLLDNGCVDDLSEAIRNADELSVHEGTLLDAASEFFDEMYGQDIPEQVKPYIDYEAFARDMRLGGDMSEFEFCGKTYTCTNANF